MFEKDAEEFSDFQSEKNLFLLIFFIFAFIIFAFEGFLDSGCDEKAINFLYTKNI